MIPEMEDNIMLTKVYNKVANFWRDRLPVGQLYFDIIQERPRGKAFVYSTIFIGLFLVASILVNLVNLVF